jgi:hypothetical protein
LKDTEVKQAESEKQMRQIHAQRKNANDWNALILSLQNDLVAIRKQAAEDIESSGWQSMQKICKP